MAECKTPCNACNKTGFRILLTRYAVAPKSAEMPNADNDIWATLAEEKGMMKPDSYQPVVSSGINESFEKEQTKNGKSIEDVIEKEVTAHQKEYEYGGMMLGDTAHYTRRLLRSGYVYVFDEKGGAGKNGKWYGWRVTDLSYMIPFDVENFDGSDDSFEDGKKGKDDKPVYCNEAQSSPIMGAISIPEPFNPETVLWIAFSDSRWTKDVFNKHKLANFRGKHMRKFDLKRWLGGSSHPHAQKIDEVADSVAEYSKNAWKGCASFTFSDTPFNYRRHLMSEVIATQSRFVIANRPNLDDSTKNALLGTRQEYNDYVLPTLANYYRMRDDLFIKEYFDSGKMVSEVCKGKFCEVTNPVSFRDCDLTKSVFSPASFGEMSYSAMQSLMQANTDETVAQLIKAYTTPNKKNAAIFTLDDPVGIAADLAFLAHAREENYIFLQNKNEDNVRKSLASAGILTIKDGLARQWMHEATSDGERVKAAEDRRRRYLSSAYSSMLKNSRWRDPRTLPRPENLPYEQQVIANALGIPSIEELEDHVDAKWNEDYGCKYNEDLRLAFESEEENRKYQYELENSVPIIVSYIYWMRSYRLASYLACNFDESNIASGIDYTETVSKILAGAQTLVFCRKRLVDYLFSIDNQTDANFVLRALVHNQKTGFELNEAVAKGLEEIRKYTLSQPVDDKARTNLQNQVIEKISELNSRIKVGKYQSVAQFKETVALLTRDINPENVEPSQALAIHAVYYTQASKALTNVVFYAGPLLEDYVSKIESASHSALSRIISQLSGPLTKCFAGVNLNNIAKMQKLCSLVSMINNTPILCTVDDVSDRRLLQKALVFYKDKAANSKPSSQTGGYKGDKWQRITQDYINDLKFNPQKARELGGQLAKLTPDQQALVVKALNSADLPDEYKLILREVTGADLWDTASNLHRQRATVLIMDPARMPTITPIESRRLNAELKDIDRRLKGQLSANEDLTLRRRRASIERMLKEGINVYDDGVIAFRFDSTSGLSIEQQVARQRDIRQRLANYLGTIINENMDKIQGRFTQIGAIVQGADMLGAVIMLASGQGMKGEAPSRLAGAIIGSIGVMFDRVAKQIKNEVFVAKGMFGRWAARHPTMVKVFGRLLGAAAGVVLAAWDAVYAFMAFSREQYLLGILYTTSALVTFATVVVIFMRNVPNIYVWAGVVISLILVGLIIKFSDDSYQEWLYQCFYGKCPDGEKYKDSDLEMTALKKCFEPSEFVKFVNTFFEPIPGTRHKKIKYVGGHANPIDVVVENE